MRETGTINQDELALTCSQWCADARDEAIDRIRREQTINSEQYDRSIYIPYLNSKNSELHPVHVTG